MNIFSEYRQHLMSVLSALQTTGDLPVDINTAAITLEPPRDASHGDMSTNAAMVLAKPAKQKPRDIAEKLAGKLRVVDGVAAVDVAGPGFINIRLGRAAWISQVKAILNTGEAYGSSEMGAAQKVNVEYVSANPTGPLHVGHVRGAVFGDALANLLLKAGYDVSKEYYINDAGGQIDVLARSAYLRYQQALGEDIGDIPEGLYPGDYLLPVGKEFAEKFGDQYQGADEDIWLPVFREAATAAMMDLIRDDLATLGIHHDVFFSELTLHNSGRIPEAVELLRQRGHIYEGVLEPPKGKKPEDWEPREQTLFRATDFGDDVDRPLQKSDGAYTYFGADIAYHLDKYQRGFKEMINVWGADHGGYVKRVQAAIKAIFDDGELDVRLAQLVRLFRNGEPAKMSKRSGNFVTMRDLVSEVGKDVTRFIMLTRKNDAPLDFDFDKVLEQSKDNPVFYVQYAHARIASVMRKAAAEMPDLNLDTAHLAEADFAVYFTDEEAELVQRMAQWPRMVELAAAAHEPHRVAFYLYDLASDFHAFWNRGNSSPDLRMVHGDDVAKTRARLAVAQACGTVLRSGLGILGVTPVSEM